MIRFEAGSVASIILDRPKQRNALTPQMLRSIPDCVNDAQGSRVIVVRGEGRMFCAGFDLKSCAEDGSVMRSLLLGLASAIRSLRECPVPVVVACHGGAIAGGCALLGGADVVVADENAKLGYPVVRLGVSPAVSAPYLRRAVGDAPARALMLDTELISGRRGWELGLVHELVGDREEVQSRAEEIANDLAAKPPGAVGRTKSWLGEIMGPASGEIERALEVSLGLAGSDEERERLATIWGS